MIYQIELSLLERLCPVFGETSTLGAAFSCSFLSKEELLSLMQNENTGTSIINLVAELKYLDREKALRTITLNLAALQEGQWPITVGTSTYIHALLKDKKSIHVEIHATSEQLSHYQLHLGINEIIEENQALVPPESLTNWLTREDLHDNAWKNVEWIKNAIKINSQALRYVDKSVWYETEFLESLVVYCDGELYHLPDEFFKSAYVLNFFAGVPDIFYEAWCHIYAGWYHENRYPEITGQINQAVFHNKERMLDMLTRGKCIELYPYMSESLKVDIDILSLSCQFFHNNLSSFTLEQYFPESFFHDDTTLKCYLLNLYPQSMPRLDETYRQKLFSHWLHDRQKVLDYFSVISQHGYGESVKVFSSFYPYLSEDMKQDKDIMLYLIEENPEHYFLLSHALQKELLHSLPDRLKRSSSALIVRFWSLIKDYKHIIYETSDIQLQKAYIHIFPELMLGAPLSWQYNPELIIAMGASFIELDSFILPAGVWSELCKNETFCLALMQEVSAEIYKILPHAAQSNPVIALEYLAQVKLKNLGQSLIEKTLDSSHDCIPKALWHNRNFCFDTLIQAEKNAQYISVNIWHDTVFILKVAQAVQDKKLKYTVFSYAPAEIDQFFQLYRTHKIQLHDFLSAFIWQRELDSSLNHKEPEKKKGKI